MILKDFLPNPSLREYIQRYRIVHFEFGKGEDVPIKAYTPKPESILHFFLHDFWAIQKPGGEVNVQPPVVLRGQSTSLIWQLTGASFINVQIVFQPASVFRLTGIPAYELTDEHVDARYLLSNIEFVLERLQSAKSYPEMLSVVKSYCFELLRENQMDKFPLDIVSRQMLQNSGQTSLVQLSDDACLCSKQFQRNFLESVGVNPKTYARIIRFNKAFNLKNAYPHKDWLSIAIECGYYDYQHLVRDYKEFTGLTPNELNTLEKQAPERVLGLTDTLYRERVSLQG